MSGHPKEHGFAAEFETTERGFKIYGEFVDRYESTVRVQESSLVGQTCCWVFAHNDPKIIEHPSPHLTAEQARKLVEYLQLFIQDAEDPENWRNDPEYRKAWGD